MEELTERTSIYDRIGCKGLLDVVWKSTPPYLRWIALPYGLNVYRDILQESATLEDVEELHKCKYKDSWLFRKLRPRFTIASDVLKKEPYNIG